MKLRNPFTNLSNQQIGIVVSGVSAIALFAYNYAIRGQSLSDATIPAILITFLGDRIGASFDNSSTRRSIETAVLTLRDAHDVTVFESPEEWAEAITRDVSEATDVENTYVGIDGIA